MLWIFPVMFAIYLIFVYFLIPSTPSIYPNLCIKNPTKITFQKVSSTEIKIIRDRKVIGTIWSEEQKNNNVLPYPHEHSAYCDNSIQICGFDKKSEMWTCGKHKGHHDIVVFFDG